MSWKEGLLIGVSLVSVAIMFLLVEPIPQWPEYHDFADARTIFGIPNALNVLSNLPFLIFGVWGVVFLVAVLARKGFNITIFLYLVFFVGFTVTAIGSGYYHYDPSNDTLVWDRLPMTIGFMGLLSAIIAELISRRVAIILLPFLLVIGAFSVFYWDWTEQLGRGDLRLYGLVQFLPFLLIALMLSLYKRPLNFLYYIAWMVAFYVLAKLFEQFDGETYTLLTVISGHSLKHVFAAVSGVFLLMMLYRRHESMYQQ